MKPIVKALMRANDELNEEEATVPEPTEREWLEGLRPEDREEATVPEQQPSGPSEAAVRVAQNAPRALTHEATIWHALRAAHDAANFEDPMDVSVRKGDLVDEIAGALRRADALEAENARLREAGTKALRARDEAWQKRLDEARAQVIRDVPAAPFIRAPLEAENARLQKAINLIASAHHLALGEASTPWAIERILEHARSCPSNNE